MPTDAACSFPWAFIVGWVIYLILHDIPDVFSDPFWPVVKMHIFGYDHRVGHCRGGLYALLFRAGINPAPYGRISRNDDQCHILKRCGLAEYGQAAPEILIN